jgi:hypothetical protein
LGGLPNNNLFKGGTNGANFVVALFALNLALSCAEKGICKGSYCKTSTSFPGFAVATTSLLLTYFLTFDLFQGNDLTTEEYKRLVNFLEFSSWNFQGDLALWNLILKVVYMITEACQQKKKKKKKNSTKFRVIFLTDFGCTSLIGFEGAKIMTKKYTQNFGKLWKFPFLFLTKAHF